MEETKKEEAYNVFMDALAYKREILFEALSSYLPEELREEKKRKLAFLEQIHDAML